MFSIRMLGIVRGFTVWGFQGLGGSMVCKFFGEFYGLYGLGFLGFRVFRI